MKRLKNQNLGQNFAENIQALSRGGFFRRRGSDEWAEIWKEGISGLSSIMPKRCGINTLRLGIIGLLLFFSVLILVGRLFHLQVARGQEYYVRSERNRYYSKNLLPDRGVIYDRNGQILARNAPAFSIGVVYSEIPVENYEVIKRDLGSFLQLSDDELTEALKVAQTQPFSETIIKRNISYDQQLAFQAREQNFPGVYVVKDAIRDYPEGEPFSTVLGYTGIISRDELNVAEAGKYGLGSYVGKAGIEREYESHLHGTAGRSVVEVEANGKVNQEATVEEPRAGKDLVLSIDGQLQKKVSELLTESIKQWNATAGSVVISDVRNGEILSMVSLPTYNNNVFYREPEKVGPILSDSRGLLLNRSISGVYAPGSTVKPAIGAMALERGVITSSSRISGQPQIIKVGNFEFPDWTIAFGRPAHGMMDLPEAIAKSSDIFFYKVGGGFPADCPANECEIRGLRVDELVTALRSFGLGEKVGVDLPGELAGLVPDPDWKVANRHESWFLGNTYHLSIGQGDLLATPIQILNLTNIVATDGSIPHLHIAKSEDVVSERKLNERKDKPVSLSNIQIARNGMVLAVSEVGIVYPLRGAKVSVAAKTGTAEFGTLNAKKEYETHAWVTGFAPADNPQISFVIMLESGGASSNAAELGRQIIDWYFGDRK